MYNIHTINQHIFQNVGYKMEKSSELYAKAKNCRDSAYAPYSNFKVGAAILTNTNKIYTGCNVENASYPCGTCAEAGAISAMIAGGDKQIKQILIVAETANILPCGNCLQKIAEFAAPNTIIYSADLQGNMRTYTLQDLLPHSFSLNEAGNA